MFIDPGTNNISRDNVAKHITSGEHKAANHLRLKWKLRNEDYQERVVMESPNTNVLWNYQMKRENRYLCENQCSSLLNKTYANLHRLFKKFGSPRINKETNRIRL